MKRALKNQSVSASFHCGACGQEASHVTPVPAINYFLLFLIPNKNVDKSQYSYFRFSDAEYAHRHKNIREFMAEQNLDCLLIAGEAAVWDRCWANIVYVMNWMGTMERPAYCIFPKEGEPVVTCLVLNAGFPDRVARATLGEVRGGTDTTMLAVERIQELGLQKGRIGLIEPGVVNSIPFNHMNTLTKELPQAEFVSVTKDWWLMRLSKSSEEVAVLAEIAHWSDLAHMELAKMIRPGVTERDLFCTVYNTVYSHGADHPSMLLIGTGPMEQSYGNFHRNRPVDRVLQRGDVVRTELGPRHPGGYEAQVGHLFTLGPPTQLYQELFGKALETHNRIRDVLLVGNTEMDVWEAQRTFRESNYNPQLPKASNWAIIHGMFSVPKDDPQQRVAIDPPKERNPFVEYQLLAVEVHAATPDFTGGAWVCKPYLVMPEGPPKALSQLPIEITVL
ncbi:M24 family metallopeptidase [Chloroflexota bacterium]